MQMVTELDQPIIHISVSRQTLRVLQSNRTIFESAISSASNGVGEISGSECTPRGWHVIRAKIGSGCVENTVFVARRPTGEVFSPGLKNKEPERDWILTRILWLSGLEPGFNRLGNVDTMRRYIYIHGCPDDDVTGVPTSHGCIKMKNDDVIRLFDLVSSGTKVLIEAK